jgi:hypothetical protein
MNFLPITYGTIQCGKIPSDVNPKIHTLEKKLKAFHPPVFED